MDRVLASGRLLGAVGKHGRLSHKALNVRSAVLDRCGGCTEPVGGHPTLM